MSGRERMIAAKAVSRDYDIAVRGYTSSSDGECSESCTRSKYSRLDMWIEASTEHVADLRLQEKLEQQRVIISHPSSQEQQCSLSTPADGSQSSGACSSSNRRYASHDPLTPQSKIGDKNDQSPCCKQAVLTRMGINNRHMSRYVQTVCAPSIHVSDSSMGSSGSSQTEGSPDSVLMHCRGRGHHKLFHDYTSGSGRDSEAVCEDLEDEDAKTEKIVDVPISLSHWNFLDLAVYEPADISSPDLNSMYGVREAMDQNMNMTLKKYDTDREYSGGSMSDCVTSECAGDLSDEHKGKGRHWRRRLRRRKHQSPADAVASAASMIEETIQAVRCAREDAAALAFKLAELHAQDAKTLRGAASVMRQNVESLQEEVKVLNSTLNVGRERFPWQAFVKELAVGVNLVCGAFSLTTFVGSLKRVLGLNKQEANRREKFVLAAVVLSLGAQFGSSLWQGLVGNCKGYQSCQRRAASWAVQTNSGQSNCNVCNCSL